MRRSGRNKKQRNCVSKKKESGGAVNSGRWRAVNWGERGATGCAVGPGFLGLRRLLPRAVVVAAAAARSMLLFGGWLVALDVQLGFCLSKYTRSVLKKNELSFLQDRFFIVK